MPRNRAQLEPYPYQLKKLCHKVREGTLHERSDRIGDSVVQHRLEGRGYRILKGRRQCDGECPIHHQFNLLGHRLVEMVGDTHRNVLKSFLEVLHQIK
jgi:hypothetical protein